MLRMAANSSLDVVKVSTLSLSWRQLLSELLPFWQCYPGSACWLLILHSVKIPGIRKYSICSNTQCLPQQTCEIRVSVIQTHPQLQTIVHLICLSFSNFRHLYIRRKKLSPTRGNEALISQHIEISFDHGFHSQMPLGIRQITQQNTVCWQEIGAFTYKKEWCPSITGRPRGQNFFFFSGKQ